MNDTHTHMHTPEIEKRERKKLLDSFFHSLFEFFLLNFFWQMLVYIWNFGWPNIEGRTTNQRQKRKHGSMSNGHTFW